MSASVLVCTDFSAASAAGEREAAARYPDDLLVVAYVVDEGLADRLCDVTGMDRGQLVSDMSTFADKRLDEIVGRLTSQKRRAVAELVLAQKGDPIDAVLALAHKHRVHTIVLGVPAREPIGRFRTMLARRVAVPLLLIPSDV